MRKTGNKGFTLIELLVVIAIIGILSSVVLASLNSARQKSRDAKRISDVKQLQLALEFFFDTNGGYPSALSIANLVTPGYIAVIPADPVGGGAYLYAAINAGCTSYHIGTTLEDSNHSALQSKVNSSGGALGTGCPDPAGATNSAADFNGTAAAIYDLKP
jgi:prepilin-type N-terminal cleavage/methylation domain-containing protein|tara:strand:+ start:9640 stop:10119 length:480 start_codon:yes stop_codon:yes gene_type:complete